MIHICLWGGEWQLLWDSETSTNTLEEHLYEEGQQ